jgi:hypothetical protein
MEEINVHGFRMGAHQDCDPIESGNGGNHDLLK